MSGDHSRQAPEARSASAVATSSVTAATHGLAAAGASGGTSSSRSRAMGTTVEAISMITVPETTGVMIRRSSGSQKASAN